MAFTVQTSDPVPSDVEAILRELPEWFGIEEALVDYVDHAAKLPTYTATVDGNVEGVCLVLRHNRYSAETYLLAVRRKLHRTGIGRALMEAVEQDAKARGVELMQVKTLGSAHQSSEYAATRRFYEALGYRSLEEFDEDTIWPGNPCVIMVKALT